jgi:hypothetical protein
MVNADLAVEGRIFVKTLEIIFLQCGLTYDNMDFIKGDITISKGETILSYNIETDKKIILSDALDMCWGGENK